MKIGILTLPLHTNYGGILQAYALQIVLQRIGHEVIVLNRVNGRGDHNAIIDFVVRVEQGIIRLFEFLFPQLFKNLTRKEKRYIRKEINLFIAKYIRLSTPLETTKSIYTCIKKNKVDAIIVGSDQCWRPRYVPNIFNYYLDFASSMSIGRFAYAASFGVDEWEYTVNETEKCSKLVQLFEAVSVREHSGIALCRKYLGSNADHVLDPTLLLSANDYKKLLSDREIDYNAQKLFCYVLDKDEEKAKVINNVSQCFELTPVYCKPKYDSTKHNYLRYREECVLPSVEEWIKHFFEADMVVCDSFHGCVFSILFNKPFWVILNIKRGRSRFESLLSTFDLKDRIITPDDISKLKERPEINWDKVNMILKEKREKSYLFLANALNMKKV